MHRGILLCNYTGEHMALSLHCGPVEVPETAAVRQREGDRRKMRTSLLVVVALTMIVAGREVRWADHHYRISNGARNGLAKHAKAVKEEKERRKMMSIENTFGPTYYLYGSLAILEPPL